MRSRVLTFLPVTLALAGCDTAPEPGEVPVARGRAAYGPSYSTSLEPVEVRLFEYISCDLPTTCSEFVTTGRSLIFAFPEAFYSQAVNARGGPQAALNIGVTWDDYTPITLLRAEREREETYRTPRATQLRQMIDKNLSLRLNTSHGAIGTPHTHVQGLRDRIASRRAEVVGNLCGMTFTYEPESPVYDRESRQVSPRITSPLLASNVSFDAFVHASGAETGAVGASCASGSRICRVDFMYRGFGGAYSIDKERFCEWPARTQRVIAFLDRHLVGSTGAYRARSTS